MAKLPKPITYNDSLSHYTLWALAVRPWPSLRDCVDQLKFEQVVLKNIKREREKVIIRYGQFDLRSTRT